jgi:hypothetical protein
MSFTTHPILLGVGLALIVVGFLMWRIAGRWDLKGQAVESALKSAWHRRVVVSEDLSDTYRDVRDAPTHMSRAGKVAGHAARHVAAQALSIASLAAFAIGVALTALAVFWK